MAFVIVIMNCDFVPDRCYLPFSFLRIADLCRLENLIVFIGKATFKCVA